MYQPNMWVVVELPGNEAEFKVFGSWRGGYLHGDSWRLNSGIASVADADDHMDFVGHSGSVYRVHKDPSRYGTTPYTGHALSELLDEGGRVLEYEEVINKWGRKTY